MNFYSKAIITNIVSLNKLKYFRKNIESSGKLDLRNSFESGTIRASSTAPHNQNFDSPNYLFHFSGKPSKLQFAR